jgi:hypothetical protein
MTIAVEKRPKSIKQLFAELMLRWLKDSIVSIEEEVAEEAVLLDHDILERELSIIDAQTWVEGQKRKKTFLINWLNREQRDQIRIIKAGYDPTTAGM